MEFLAGIAGGIVSGMGMGGGTVLIILLSIFGGIEQHVAQATNIVFFVPAAIVSIFLNIKNKMIKWKIAVPITIFGVVGAIVGAKIALILDTQNLKKCFGVFLGLIAIYEIFDLINWYKKSKNTNNKNMDTNKFSGK